MKTKLPAKNTSLSLFLAVLFMLPLSLLRAEGKTKLSGTIMGATGEEKLELRTDPFGIGGKVTVASSDLQKKRFSFEIDLNRPQILSLKLGGEDVEIYMEPGFELEVMASAGDLPNTLRFLGDGDAENRFWRAFQKEFAAQYDPINLEKNAIAQNIDLFEMDLYDQRAAQRKYLENFEEASDFSADFKTFASKHIEFHYWASIYSYPILRANNRPKDLKVNKLPSIMIQDFDAAVFEDESNMADDRFRELVHYYGTYINSEAHGFTKYTEMSKAMMDKYTTAYEELEGEVQLYFISRLLYENCLKTPPSTVRRVYNALDNLDKSGKWAEVARGRCGDRMQEEDAVEPVKDRELDDPEYAGRHNSVKFTNLKGKEISFKEFKGKVVYIDFWASWCGPCRAQFPHAKKLKEKLTKKEKKEIVFLYISIDNTEEIWRNAIDKLGIEGYHVLSPGGWNSAVIKYFKISSIPRYMIMDKKGQVVSYDAKRPSIPGLLQELRSYL